MSTTIQPNRPNPTSTAPAAPVTLKASDGGFVMTATLDRVRLNRGEQVELTLRVEDDVGEFDASDVNWGDDSGDLLADGCGDLGDDGQGGVQWETTKTHVFDSKGIFTVTVTAATILDCDRDATRESGGISFQVQVT